MNIKESPAVEALKKWCLSRLNYMESDREHLKQKEASGFRAIGEGMMCLRQDAKVSLEELAEEMNLHDFSQSDLETLEEGGQWTKEMINLYIESLGKIYLKKTLA